MTPADRECRRRCASLAGRWRWGATVHPTEPLVMIRGIPVVTAMTWQTLEWLLADLLRTEKRWRDERK